MLGLNCTIINIHAYVVSLVKILPPVGPVLCPLSTQKGLAVSFFYASCVVLFHSASFSDSETSITIKLSRLHPAAAMAA